MANSIDNFGRALPDVEPPKATQAITEVRQEVIPKLARLVIGQQLKGEILSRLNDGTFSVRVAGIVAKLQLPEGYKEGDHIPLKLVGTDPRPTFLVDNSAEIAESGYVPQKSDHIKSPNVLYRENNVVDSQAEASDFSAAPTKTSTAASRAEIVAKSTFFASTNETSTDPTELANQAAPLKLSNAARLLSQILQSENVTSDSKALQGVKPLVSTVAELKLPEQVATLLRNEINQSGLFYESHLADWASGRLTIQELAQEPQTALPPLESKISNENQENWSIANSTQQIINQQLNVLEKNVIYWRGEVLPGKVMDWKIEKDGNSSANEHQDSQGWTSTMTFNLPQLGEITAKVQLIQNKVSVFIQADQSDSRTLLLSNINNFADALQNCGTQLSSYNIIHHESE